MLTQSPILKTFENDLNGITNKIGFSKRNFAEWGSQIAQSFHESGKGLNGFKNALSTAFTLPKAANKINLISQSGFETLFNGMDSKSFFKNFNQYGSESLSTLTQWCNQFDKMEENNRQMAELQKKDHLTYVEKGQLKELQDITKELLLQQGIEEKKLDREQKDAASKAIDAYEKQYGDYDISDTAINEHLDTGAFRKMNSRYDHA